jgi:hypothetical protein
VIFDGKVRSLGPCVFKFDSTLPEDHRSNMSSVLSTADSPRHHFNLDGGSASISVTSVYRGSKWGRRVVRQPRQAKSDCSTTGDRDSAHSQPYPVTLPPDLPHQRWLTVVWLAVVSSADSLYAVRAVAGVSQRVCVGPGPVLASLLPCPVPACGRRGRLAGAGSGSHCGVEFGRSRTGWSSGGRKKGVV